MIGFLPESLPNGITVFVSARKFTRAYNDGKKKIYLALNTKALPIKMKKQ